MEETAVKDGKARDGKGNKRAGKEVNQEKGNMQGKLLWEKVEVKEEKAEERREKAGGGDQDKLRENCGGRKEK